MMMSPRVCSASATRTVTPVRKYNRLPRKDHNVDDQGHPEASGFVASDPFIIYLRGCSRPVAGVRGCAVAVASVSTWRDARHPAHGEGVLRSADAPADSWKMVSRRLK